MPEMQKLKSPSEVLGVFLYPTDAVFQMNKHKGYQQGLRDCAYTSSWSGFNRVPDMRQPDPCRGHGTSYASTCTDKAELLLLPFTSCIQQYVKDKTWCKFFQTLAQLLKLTPNAQKQDTFFKSIFLEKIQKFSRDFTKIKVPRICLERTEGGSGDGDHLQYSIPLLCYIVFQSFRMILYTILTACQIQREAIA